jgi:hypothetical protein
MSLIVLLDAGPLGMITNPKSSPENEACKNWLAGLAYNGVEVVFPEIADCEVRRELLRAGKERGLGRLDALKGMLEYAPITTPKKFNRLIPTRTSTARMTPSFLRHVLEMLTRGATLVPECLRWPPVRGHAGIDDVRPGAAVHRNGRYAI